MLEREFPGLVNLTIDISVAPLTSTVPVDLFWFLVGFCDPTASSPSRLCNTVVRLMPVYGARYQAINNRWRDQLVEDLRVALRIDRDDPDRVIQVMYQGKVLPEDPLGIRVGERTLDVFPPPASLPVKPIVGREVDMKAWGDAVDRWGL